ncbi:MAG: metallophosphoesterase [Lachnospiraceae bacterium]|nr:metallophosphoesterase [Lachnospiraceae bacterium]
MKVFRKILKRLVVSAVVLAGIFCLNQWMNGQIFVRQIVVESADLPKAFEGYRILQLTDIHSVRSREQGELILSKVEKEAPDVIAVTGDLVDSYYYTQSAAASEDTDEQKSVPDQLTLELMQKLVKVAPVYMVYGNHEMVLLDDPDKNPLKVAMEKAGVVLLNHEKIRLERDGEFIWLAGVQDPIVLYKDELFAGSGDDNRTRLEAELSYISEVISEEDFTVLLSHRPEYFELYTQFPVDLALTGHAHGGQVRIPFVGGLYAPGQGFFPRYTSGLYEEGDFQMITGRGIGNSKNLMRVFDPPEIIVTELSEEIQK